MINQGVVVRGAFVLFQMSFIHMPTPFVMYKRMISTNCLTKRAEMRKSHDIENPHSA